MPLNPQHQTVAQYLVRLRGMFRDATKIEAARLANRIIDHILAGDVTDTQVRTAFGLNTTQYNALKTKLTTLRDNYLAVQSAAGE